MRDAMQSIRVNTFAFERERERETNEKRLRIDRCEKRETESGICSRIQRRVSVTLFYDSVDCITLIARRVKLPRGRLLSSDLLECVDWPGHVGSGTENRAYTRQVFSSSLRVIVGRVIHVALWAD